MTDLFDIEFSKAHEELVLIFNDLQLSVPQSSRALDAFVAIIKAHHKYKRRSFLWREIITEYSVTVSEIMLQQTQTERVATKFGPFLEKFADFKALAEAPFEELLRLWKGLGYNRRALALQKIAQKVVNEYAGLLPNEPLILETFPHIGKATACSITTFAFNIPTVFIETNIRTVFIYYFFNKETLINDKQIMPLIAETLDLENPREWYYALMDHGVMLKKEYGNLSRLSAHYTKQSKFEGSDRQIRGMILQALLDHSNVTIESISYIIKKDKNRVDKILKNLCVDGLITLSDNFLKLRE
jgi:A/G-specific adenine glycosylase